MKRLLLLLLPIAAFAQSVPNGTITQGEVWTPAQWNNAWSSKTDYPAPCAALPPLTGAITSTGCATTFSNGVNLQTPSAINLTNAINLPNSALPANLASSPANTVLGCGASPCAPSGLTAAPLAALQNAYSAASVLRARDYGILPTNTAAQNDTGFSALRTKMLTSVNTWNVIFEPGIYLYTNNQWLWNVQSVILTAWGVSFENTNSSAFYINDIPFNNGDAFGTSGYGGSGTTFTNGYLINTAVGGSYTVTTSTAADAGNFSAGQQVLVYGYDQQQGGWPPNMRYFDFATVVSAVAGTGVVTLTAPLRNSYDSRWWDTANYSGGTVSYGAPRILNLQRADYSIPQMIWIIGATFLVNPNQVAANYLQFTGQLIVYDHVTGAPGMVFFGYESNQFYVNSSNFNAAAISESMQPDKIIDTFVMQDSTINGGNGTAISDCAGCNNEYLLRDTFYGVVSGAARNLTVMDSDIVPYPSYCCSAGQMPTNFPQWTFNVGNLHIFNTGGLLYGFTQNPPPGLSATAGTGSAANTIKMTYSSNTAFADAIDYGTFITDVTTPCTSTGITAIYLSGSTLVVTAPGCTYASGDTLNYYTVQLPSDLGGNIVINNGSATIPLWRPPIPGISTNTTFINGLTLGKNQSLTFPGVANTYITDTNYGIQFTENSSNIFYLSAGALLMQQSFYPKNIIGGTSFNILSSQTAPTISSGFGSSPSISKNNGTSSFSVNVGTGGAATSGVVSLPTAANAWACWAADTGTTPTGRTEQTGTSTATATFTNYSRTTGSALAWTASEIIQIGCVAN